MKTLFVNACTRKDSRTLILSNYLLDNIDSEKETINLYDLDLKPFNEQMILYRDKCILEGNYNDKMFDLAKKFASADIIVIGAPTWDLSFPAILKLFIEYINVVGLTFEYNGEQPYSLCNAKRLIYVTTAGGYVTEQSYGYIKALCDTFYGIKKVDVIKAECLDMDGVNIQEKLDNAKKEIDKLVL